jgi:lambda repressor-like predicted transcriptional regulator
MHPAVIKASLELAGCSQAAIAADLGLDKRSVYQVVHGLGRSARVEKRISRIIGRKRHEIWPQWYDTSGLPITRRRRPNPSALEDLMQLTADMKG